MYLSDTDIKKALKNGDVKIDNFDETRLQPASYDILLDNKFIITDAHFTDYIDPVRKIFPKTREVIISDNEMFTLHPGMNVLGTSRDYFGSDKYLVQLSGKSSLARIGLVVHNTAGVINPGHFLHITFELSNVNSVPIILRPGMAIGQILFSMLSSPTQKSYKDTGRYHKNDWTSYIPPKEKMPTVKMYTEKAMKAKGKAKK